MLVLTRRIGQEICLGEDILIKLLNLNCHGIVIGIDAPADLNIVRREIKYREAGHFSRAQAALDKALGFSFPDKGVL